MFVFKREQQVFNVGGIRLGGQPGENPTVLVGGLFFKGQPIVHDTKEGRFDEEGAREWLEAAKDMSERTGHPFIVEVYARTPVAMERHIGWLVENYDGPFMFESVNSRARTHGIKYCDETGLADRAIYNSLSLSTKDEERRTLQESSIHMAVVLGWSPRATMLPDRMKTIESMVSEARSLGVEEILVDPATLPVGAGFGLEFRTTLAVKSELGLPTCLGPHNAPSAWKFIRKPPADGESAHLSAVVAATVAAQLFATDCVMYGSMIRTREVFTAVALIGNAMAAAAAEARAALGMAVDLFEPLTTE
ncbi:MAG: hypothetical protein ACTSVD_08865 [Candidatus Thorarchaeota archaeon]